MERTIKRILVYTHNSVGMGHVFRTLAVISGIKHHRPDIDFLVLSGSSIPHMFLSQGIEVVKLPGIKKDVEKPGSPLHPRYLTTLGASAVFEYRQRLILDTFEFFSPDVVMVEHYMGGLMNEVMPLIQRRRTGEKLPREWLLVHLSRGICPTFDLQAAFMDSLPAGQGCNVIDTARQFDFIYVFEDREKVDLNHERLGKIPDLRSRIHYLGPIAVKAAHELPPRREAIRRLGLVDKRIILMSLGRHGPVLQMAETILAGLRRYRLQQDYHIVMVIDPYLDHELARAFQENTLNEDVQVLSFTPHLIDLINISELVICRAGYNTINEVLMTGVTSLVIPERHPGAEQERRAGLIQQENIMVADEDEILNGCLPGIFEDLLSRDRRPAGNVFDKYAIGRRILRDLESRSNGRLSERESRGEDGLSHGLDA